MPRGRPRKYHTEEERREASREHSRRWREKNPRLQEEHSRRWREKNPERVREYYRDWRKRNPESDIARRRRWTKNHPKRRKYNSKRAQARAKGIEFTLTFEEIVWPDVCPALGIDLDYGVTGRKQDNSPSFDRIDPTKGYVPGNVQILSDMANRIKTNATPEQVALVAAFMRSST